MTEYQIYNWDAVKFCSTPNPLPMIFVKPDKHLLSKLNKGDRAVIQVTISDTNSLYDGVIVNGLLSLLKIFQILDLIFLNKLDLWLLFWI